MDKLLQLPFQQPVVALHLVTALLALVVGALLMTGRKGNLGHRVLGWTFVVMLGTATITSAFIRDHGLPNLAGFTPIHLLTVVTAVFLPLGVWRARRGDVAGHRRLMTRLFTGAGVIAGLFTLLPGRLLGDLLWHQGLGL